MNRMYSILFILLTLLTNTSHALSEQNILNNTDGTLHNTLKINKSENTLIIEMNDKTYRYENTIGIEGQVYKDFLIFNNQPALWYSNTTSKNEYDIYYTLIIKKNGAFIDCAYATITLSDYSIVLNRAICGLKKPLNADYTDLIYPYSNNWENNIEKQIEKQNYPSNGNLVLIQSDNFSISTDYNINKGLNTNIPTLTLKIENKEYRLPHRKIYLVSLFNTQEQLARLEEVTDKEERNPFIRKTITEIKKISDSPH